MDRADEAVRLFRGNYCCSQAVLMAHADDYGLTKNEAARLAAGFGGGMRLGSVCGAATGAIMVIGLHFEEKCETSEGRVAINDAVREFGKRFTERVSALDCPEILGCDIRTAEGKAKAEERELHDTVCVEAIREAARILDEILMGS